MKFKLNDETSFLITETDDGPKMILPKEVYDGVGEAIKDEIDKDIITKMIKAAIGDGHKISKTTLEELEKRFGKDILESIVKEESNEN